MFKKLGLKNLQKLFDLVLVTPFQIPTICSFIGKLPICKNLSADTETDNGFSYRPIPIYQPISMANNDTDIISVVP